MSYQDFQAGYVACLLWLLTDEDGEPVGNDLDASDLAPESLARIESECQDFYEANSERWQEKFRWSDEQAGHDFYLTRNGHGAGFWDRYGYNDEEGKAVGDYLTKQSEPYGETWEELGDGGKVYTA